MEDKTFELLSKMYAEINKRFDNVNKEIKSVGNRITKIEIAIENQMRPDIKACLEGYRHLAEGQEIIKDQLSDIQTKVDKQEVEITVIKGGKYKKA